MKKLQALFLVAVLLTVSTLSACNWGDVDRRVTVAGYSLHLSIEATALTAQAFKNRNRLNPDDYKALLARLSGLTEAAQRVNIRPIGAGWPCERAGRVGCDERVYQGRRWHPGRSVGCTTGCLDPWADSHAACYGCRGRHGDSNGIDYFGQAGSG